MAPATLHKMDVLANLNGGLVDRPTPLIIDSNTDKRMPSPALKNVDFFATGGIDKRLGKTLQGSALASTAYQSQLTEDLTVSLVAVGEEVIAQKITTGAAVSVQSMTVKAACLTALGGPISANCLIFTDVAGSPGVQVANGASTAQAMADSATPGLVTFNFPTPPSLSGATVYWFLFDFSTAPGDTAYMKATAGVAGNVKTDADYASTWASLSRDLYYTITSTATGTVVQGVYDYRFGSASTQRIMAAMGGTLFYHARNATPLTGAWTSLTTGLGSGQDVLFDFVTLKNLLITSDYGNATQRVWDGAAAYTIAQGFRATFTTTRSTAAGTVAAGWYGLIAVTTLISGGYRASAIATIDMTGGGTQQVVVGSVVMDGTGATNFGFDIAATATTWYMTTAQATQTLVSSATYYKLVGTTDMSVANPAPNNTTTFNITDDVAGTETTLLDDYGLEQGYFTSQIATPVCKFMAVWQGMVVMSDGAKLYFSEVGAPNIWSDYGGLLGGIEEINTADGETITGIYVHDGYLYPFKRHSTFIGQFTGNAQQPFAFRQISENVGSLSHFSAVGISGMGIAFMSQQGAAMVSGTVVRLLPASAELMGRFEPNSGTRYNLAAMAFTTAGLNVTKQQIHWGVSSLSATTRDLTLVYDYGNRAFWENDVSANYYVEISDGNFFPSIWSGDYSARIFQMDAGTNDNGSAIDFYFDTPHIQLQSPFFLKRLEQVHIAGGVQSSGTLAVDVYLDFSSSISRTLVYDMSNAKFKSGIAISLGVMCKAVRFRLRNNVLDVPVHIDSIGLSYQILREASGAA